LSYIPEIAWNATSFEIANGGSLAATGDGVSTRFPKPSWQIAPGVPNDGQRDVPDISFAADFNHDGYLICSNGSCVNGYRDAGDRLFVVGGTSAGVPVFAGIAALINQQIGAAQGNVNPRLYQLAAASTDVFHDITSGDNKVPCTAGTTDCPNGGQIGYSAGPGYDRVTGLGSVNAFNLVQQWGMFKISLSASTLTLTAGTTANVGTVTVNVAPLNSFTGTVAFTCAVPASLSGTTCSVSPNSVTTSGTATVTVTAPSSRASLHPPRDVPRFFPWTDGTFALALGLMIAGKRDHASRKKLAMAILLGLVVIAGAAMAGCGGGGSSANRSNTFNPTTVRTGTVFIQGASQGVTQTAAIAVTVN
jgi:subtilase family serine protease